MNQGDIGDRASLLGQVGHRRFKLQQERYRSQVISELHLQPAAPLQVQLVFHLDFTQNRRIESS